MMIMNQVVAMRTGASVRAKSVLAASLAQLGMSVIVQSESAKSNRVDNVALVALVNVLAAVCIHQSVSLVAGTLVRAKCVQASLFTQVCILRTLVHIDTILSSAIITESGLAMATIRARSVVASGHLW